MLLILYLRCGMASTIVFREEEDALIWQFTSCGVYSVQSLYKIINFRRIQLVLVPYVWFHKFLPRVHYFLRLLTKNKLLTRDKPQ